MDEQNLKEIFNKYNITEEDFLKNLIKSVEVKTDLYSGLTMRESKSLYKEISNYCSTIKIKQQI